MTAPIEDWWAPLDVELRRWITNNIWTAMHDYARSEIRRFGGPDDTDDFWQVWDDGSRLLPPEAVRWIVTRPDAESLREPLDVELRRWITNNIWTAMHDYARSEIRRFGGPDDTDDFWQVWDDGSRLLPPEAVRWIVTRPDAESLREPVQEDPSAAYFKRQHWPYREATSAERHPRIVWLINLPEPH